LTRLTRSMRSSTNGSKRGLYLECGIIIQAIDALGRNHDSKRKVAQFLAAAKTPSSNEWLVNLAIGEALREEAMRKKIKEDVKAVGQIAYVLDMDGRGKDGSIRQGRDRRHGWHRW